MQLIKRKTALQRVNKLINYSISELLSMHSKSKDKGEQAFLMGYVGLLLGLQLIFHEDTPAYYRKWLSKMIEDNSVKVELILDIPNKPFSST